MSREKTVPEDLFHSANYDHYVVKYRGDIVEEVSKYTNYWVTIINDRFAIMTVMKNIEINIGGPYFTTVVYVQPADMFTLQQISPIEAAQVNFLQLDLPLNLTGRGVDVAIIDTGIDYLNVEFMNASGETRIGSIWDQTIEQLGKEQKIPTPYGTVYMKDEIQSAIQLSRDGGSPYELVSSKDEIGHGTSMAGIVGATGNNPQLKGVVPECEFIIIKLVEDLSLKEEFDIKIPVFNITTIFTALEFVYRYASTNNKPTVIYFPLGSNLGNHKISGILGQYIEEISRNTGIVVVAGAGNQRESGTHTSGQISTVGEKQAMEIDVSSIQKKLWVDIWIDQPNIMSLEIVSPSGENTGTINVLVNSIGMYTFLFEKTSIKVNYYVPEEITGDELIRIRFSDLKSGIWLLRLTGNSILDGKFNAWIPQEGITVGGTRFSFSDPYGTITNPNSDYLVTAAAYNQNNDNIVNYSGMAFMDNYIGRIDVAAGGVNAISVAPGNKLDVVNGTSVAAAVVTGACAMLFQWGIIDGNYPRMYSQTIKTYLARGTIKRRGDVYPNPQFGYGILDVVIMFENIM
jgi:subtilisin family serine protease